jgi:hypothetical protein
MSWWERLKAVLRREAADVTEGFGKVAQSLDDELARKERKLAAGPEERIDILLEEQAGEDARFRELEERLRKGPPPDPPHPTV